MGVHLSFLCPELVEFFGYLGFQWLFLDAEHTPLNHHLARELIRAADGVAMPCLVRVPQINSSVIEGFLDAGAQGIIAPNVTSVAEARALVAAVKFSPRGDRGSAPKSRAARYGLGPAAGDFHEAANRTTRTVALIESQGGVDHLDGIMDVPGLDYVAIGANDLGLSLGIVGGTADARVRAVVDGVQARISARGKPQLVVVPDAEQVRKAVAEGAQLIAIPDTNLVAASGRAFLAVRGIPVSDVEPQSK
jgi:2-keto-3-deoxy-L-rhamnonate aldolase RhmA